MVRLDLLEEYQDSSKILSNVLTPRRPVWPKSHRKGFSSYAQTRFYLEIEYP
jgi:hypothetical protein